MGSTLTYSSCSRIPCGHQASDRSKLRPYPGLPTSLVRHVCPNPCLNSGSASKEPDVKQISMPSQQTDLPHQGPHLNLGSYHVGERDGHTHSEAGRPQCIRLPRAKAGPSLDGLIQAWIKWQWREWQAYFVPTDRIKRENFPNRMQNTQEKEVALSEGDWASGS